MFIFFYRDNKYSNIYKKFKFKIKIKIIQLTLLSLFNKIILRKLIKDIKSYLLKAKHSILFISCASIAKGR